MRTVSLVVFLGLMLTNVFAKTYYISSVSGNDSNSGLRMEEAIQSLQRMSFLAQYLEPGDSILLKKNEQYYGSLQLSNVGGNDTPIYIGAYGMGSEPVLTGQLSGLNWKESDGIYSTKASTHLGQAYFNGRFIPFARYPESGYLTFEAQGTGNGFTVSNQDSDFYNEVDGANVIMRTTRWSWESRTAIVDNKRITFDRTVAFVPRKGYGYFLNNKIDFLKKEGTWVFNSQDSTAHLIPMEGTRPENYAFSSIETGVILDNVLNIVINGLVLEYFYADGFVIKNNSERIAIDNCKLQYLGRRGVLAASKTNSRADSLKVTNSSFNFILSSGIWTSRYSMVKITNNTFKNIAPVEGYWLYPQSQAIAMYGDGAINARNSYIANNIIDSIGNNGIYFHGRQHIIENNIITNTMLSSDDAAAIGWYGKNVNTDSCIVRGNLIKNAKGSVNAVNDTISSSIGLYSDDLCSAILVENNTIINSDFGIYIHNNQNMSIVNNEIINNRIGIYVKEDYNGQRGYMKDNLFLNNQIYSRPGQLGIELASFYENIKLGVFDKNTLYSSGHNDPIRVAYRPDYKYDPEVEKDVVALQEDKSFVYTYDESLSGKAARKTFPGIFKSNTVKKFSGKHPLESKAILMMSDK